MPPVIGMEQPRSPFVVWFDPLTDQLIGGVGSYRNNKVMTVLEIIQLAAKRGAVS